jgi:hypothetical protein
LSPSNENLNNIFASIRIKYYGSIRFIMAALIGVSLRLIGGGGSIPTVPILVYVRGLNPILATSYSLFIAGSTSMVGAVNNYRNGFVNIKTALVFGLSSITTVFIMRKIKMPAIQFFLSTEHFLYYSINGNNGIVCYFNAAGFNRYDKR